MDEPHFRHTDLTSAFGPADEPEAGLAPDGPTDTPSWAELTALPPKHRRPRIGALGLIAIAAGLVLVAALVGLLILVRSEQGQVMFTTTDPHGGNSCIVIDRVSTVPAGTHAWMVMMLGDRLDDQPLTMDVLHDGAPYWSYTWPISDSQGRMCTYSDDLASYPPGTWTFTFTHAGKTEATGTLTIT